MEKNVLNYRIIVEPDERTGTKQKCYVAYCPTLGIANDGDTIEEALRNIKEGIECFVEGLVKIGEEIPQDKIEEAIITSTKLEFKTKPQFAFV